MRNTILFAAALSALTVTAAYAQSAGVTSGASGAASTDTMGTGMPGAAAQTPSASTDAKAATGAPQPLGPSTAMNAPATNTQGNAALGGNIAAMGGGGSVGTASGASTP